MDTAQAGEPWRPEPSGAGSPPEPAGAGALPVQPTTFVGRQAELARLGRLLADHRLVTITGPGGAGKTRLAVAAATAAAGTFPAGAFFVDLAPGGPELVGPAVADAIGVVIRPGRSLAEAVHGRLGTGRSLVVLDNCEHVVDAASALAGQLVAGCPGVSLLATSRERLGAAGEQVVAAAPLPDPEAVALFLDRARAVAPRLAADPDRIGEICARCDGLPLAIELAAARCASLGVDGLLAGLDDRLRLLVGSRVPTERHRSLRAVLDWSHDLLASDEQALFRRLAVFAGGCDIAAAAAVTGAHTGAPDLIDGLGRLTDQNLLERQSGPAGSRWRMLDVVRSYARNRLAASDEAAEIWARYQLWAGLVTTRLEHRLDTGEPWRDEFDAVASDLRAALTRPGRSARPPGRHPAADPPGSGDHRLILSLAVLYTRRGAFTLAQAAYEEVMTVARATGNAALLAQAALGASLSGMLFGVTLHRRVTLLEEALALQGPEPTGIRARLMARLATELYWSADRAWSLTLADEAFTIADELDDDGARAHALYARHYITRGPANWRERLDLADRIVGRAQRAGDTQLELAGQAARAVGLMEAGDLTAMDATVAALGEAADELDHPEFQWYAAVYRLVRALVSGRFTDADRLAAAATASAEHAPEFSIGLFFAEAVTDLRGHDDAYRRRRRDRLREMAERFPRVLVWQCRLLLEELAVGEDPGRVRQRAHTLTGELLKIDPRDGHWLVGVTLLAEVAHAVADPALAAPLAGALRPCAGRLAVAGRVAAFRGSVCHALGLLSITLDEPEAAVGHLRRAVAQHQRIGARPFHTRSLAALNQARSREGRTTHE